LTGNYGSEEEGDMGWEDGGDDGLREIFCVPRAVEGFT
jgi:hypothetical protein